MAGDIDEETRAYCWQFEGALAHFRHGQIEPARTGFEGCRRIRPDDRAALVFLDRIRLVVASVLPDGWDGVWTPNQK